MKNWIFRNFTGYLDYTTVLTDSVLFLGLPILSKLLTSFLSAAFKTGLQNYYDTNYSMETWILKHSNDLLEYMYICIQSRSLSSYNSMTAFDCSTLYTTNPHSTLRQIKRIGSTLFHTNRMANIDTNRKRHIVFGNKNYSDSNEHFSELASLRCSSF